MGEEDLDLGDATSPNAGTSTIIGANDATGEFQLGEDELGELGESTQDVDLSQLDDTSLEEEEIQFEQPEEKPSPERPVVPDEDLELEGLDEPEEEFEEIELSKGQQILAQLTEKAPFLAKIPFIANKLPGAGEEAPAEKPKKQLPKNIRDPENESDDEGPKSKFEIFVEEKIPALAPIVAKFKKGKSGGESTGYYGDQDGEDEEEKPKRKIKVIHIIIVAALAGVLLYEEEPGTGEAPPAAKIKPKYKKKKPAPSDSSAVAKKDAPKKAEPEKAAGAGKEDSTEQPKELPEKQPKEEDIIGSVDSAKGDTKGIEEKEFELPKETVTEEESKKGAQEKTTDEELDDLFGEETIAAEKPKEKPKETPKETPKEAPTEKPGEESEPVVQVEPDVQPEEKPAVDASPSKSISDELSLDDAVVDQVATTGGGEEITEAILKQLEMSAQSRRDEAVGGQKIEPTDAPSYLDLGPGLVYNCSGRHWACVSKPAFTKCGKNYAWNVKEANPIECYPSELYENDMDCASMQQYKIDMAAETKFCD